MDSISITNQDENLCFSDNLLKNSDFNITKRKDLDRIQKRGWSYSKNIPGWKLENKGKILQKGFERITPPEGASDYFIELDAKPPSKKHPKPDALEQTIQTIKGNTYQLSFYLRKRQANHNEALKLSWNDGTKTNKTHTLEAKTTNSWEQHQYEFTATSKQSTIRFEELAEENDSHGILISKIELAEECPKEDTGLSKDPADMIKPKETGDVYLLIDTSTSMLRSGSKDRIKLQSLVALKAFTEDIERGGYQIQRIGTNSTISPSQLQQKLSDKTTRRAINELNNYTIIDNPNDGKEAKSLNINLLTYNYGVQHKRFILSHEVTNGGIDIMRNILSLKMAGEQSGNSTKNNPLWKKLDLPEPNQLDLFQANKKAPSNLYAGTEMLGALEGLEYLLNKKASDSNRQNQSTSITMVADGRPERRSWWDTRTSAVSDSIIGQPIPLPKSLGQEDITTSGLLYDNNGKPQHLKNNKGQWQWKQMQKDLNASLDRLADQSTNPMSDIQIKLYGLDDTSNSSLSNVYQDLFAEQTFNNSSSNWSYSHQTI